MKVLRLLALLYGVLAGGAFAQPADPAATIARYEGLYRDTGNASLLWLIAETQAAAGNRAEAVRALERVAEARIGFSAAPGSALLRLAGDPDYDQVTARIEAELPRVRRGRFLAEVRREGLIPEGIAIDARRNRIILGDMNGRELLAIEPDGRVRSFGEALALRPLGMAVDAARDLLWVATSDAFWASPQPRSALVALDLATGQVRRSVTGRDVRSLNDMAIAADGTIFVTDSLAGAVFRLDPQAEALVRIAPTLPMSYPNGIALSGDGRVLFVAQGASIRRIEIATGAGTSLAQPPGLALLGIDGLYRHGDRLVAVQNGGTPGRVLLLDLDAEQRAISGFSLLEAGNPELDIPTTAALAGNRLVLLANSQLTRLAQDGSVTPGPALAPIRLLEIAIPPRG